MNNKDLIECIKAEEEGREIQFLTVFFDGRGWRKKIQCGWDTDRYIYRIKPEPKEVWIWEYSNRYASIAWGSEEVCRSEYCGYTGEPRLFREVTDE